MQPYLRPPEIMSNLVCEGFSSCYVLLKYGHENADVQERKFDDITLQYSNRVFIKNVLLH